MERRAKGKYEADLPRIGCVVLDISYSGWDRFDLSPKKTFSNPWFGNMIDGSGEARNENCIVCRFKIIVRIIDSMIDILVDTIIA